MKTFKGFNQTGSPCPICKTNEDRECVLVPKPETSDDGTVECDAVHTGCLELVSTKLPSGRRLIHHVDPVEEETSEPETKTTSS